ncbi:MAG: histidine kinase [Cyclobacteriaceae bacterium]
MKHYFFHNPVFRIVAPAIYGVFVYFLILLVNNNVAQINELFVTQELYVCIFLSYLSFESVRTLILLLSRILRGKKSALVMALQVVITMIFSVGLIIACLTAYFRYVIGFSISDTQLMIFAVVFLITALLYNVMYFSNYYLHQENTVKLNAEKQQRTVLEMEMMEYRNDINPDLLYESLENLIGIMYREVEKAEDYIDWLGSAYRYVLTNRKNEMVTIREELEAAKNIVRLLNEKYGGQLILESNLNDADLQAMLIPGSLPVIIESLVRNTIITRFEPFFIRCYQEEGYLTIETKLNDRLIRHQPSEDAFGRLQRSYAIYTELPLIKVKAYTENYIKLPVIRVMEEMGAPA